MAWVRIASEAIALDCRLLSWRTELAELREFRDNGRMVAATSPLGDIPLVERSAGWYRVSSGRCSRGRARVDRDAGGTTRSLLKKQKDCRKREWPLRGNLSPRFSNRGSSQDRNRCPRHHAFSSYRTDSVQVRRAIPRAAGMYDVRVRATASCRANCSWIGRQSGSSPIPAVTN